MDAQRAAQVMAALREDSRDMYERLRKMAELKRMARPV